MDVLLQDRSSRVETGLTRFLVGLEQERNSEKEIYTMTIG